jgi:signal transduction histidine kinase/CheY-like chemotaxis protein
MKVAPNGAERLKDAPPLASRSWIDRFASYLDSFHGVVAGKISGSGSSGGPGIGVKRANELDVWRLRSLVLVSWSTGISGAMLVPLYLLGNSASQILGCILIAGASILIVTPFLFRSKRISQDGAAQLVAITCCFVMTILTIASGGFPMGLAPGIQRILPIMVLCFGSLRLGLLVTLYVMLECVIHQFFAGSITPAIDDQALLLLIIGGSWLLQPVILLMVGVSLHMAGSQTILTLQALSEAKARFLSVVSHELRTPCHGILGSCEAALFELEDVQKARQDDDSSSHELQAKLDSSIEALRTIEAVAKHLSVIVEDLLLYSSSSLISIQEKRFGILPLFKFTEATLSRAAARAGCTLTFCVAPDIQHLWFIGDELRLRQAIINVVNNALKYAPGGPVAVRLDSVTPSHEMLYKLEISVKDNGPGIPEEDLQRIFLPFEQAGTDLSKFAGVGLGLSLVTELLNKMKGGIRCESTLGQGATFFLTVQCCKAEPPQHEEAKDHPPAPTALPVLSMSLIQPTILPSRNNSTSPASSADPIVIVTTNSIDLSSLSDDKWIGEDGMFDVRSDVTTWDALVDFVRDTPLLEADVIVFDNSKEAYAAAEQLRALIRAYSVPAVPILHISESRPLSLDTFDASIHPSALPALARSWYRAMALGTWILVVDDVPLNRKILRGQLTRLGHRVTEATNGLEACEAASAAGFAMDMIAMDLMMPIMDGQTAAKNIRKMERLVRPSCRPCPIFAVTAGNESIMKDEDAFCGFLQKPTSTKKLRGLVRYQVIRRMLPPLESSLLHQT